MTFSGVTLISKPEHDIIEANASDCTRISLDTPKSLYIELKVQSVMAGLSLKDYILKVLKKETEGLAIEKLQKKE